MKLAGLDQFFKNNIENKVQDKMESYVNNALAQTNIDDLVQKSMIAKITMLASGLVVFAGFIAAVLINIFIAAILLPVGFTIFFIAIYLFRSYRKKWLEAINLIISFNQLCKLFFESKYENLQVLGQSEVDMDLVKRFRGEGVPRDATIKLKSSGPRFLLDGIEFHLLFVRWKWYERSGKERVEVNQDKFITYVPKVPSRWEGFALSLTPSSFFDNKGKELENEKFNKSFSYTHNDPVRLRILLTPFIQENFVNYFHLTSSYTTHRIDFLGRSVFTTKHALSGDPFNIDKIPMKKSSELVAIIFREVIDDLRYIEEQLTILSTFREFIINR